MPPFKLLFVEDDDEVRFVLDEDGLHAHETKDGAVEAALLRARTCPECGHVR